MKNKSKVLSEDKEIIDLGISSKVIDAKRIINRDGSFNVFRKGLKFFESFSTYHWLISMSWTRFCLLILGSYLLVNIFFASLYYLGGEENFEGIKASTNFERFLNEFFFSTQTFTTVGYGRVNPVGVYANIISSIESLMGLLSLAVATGLLYGRFVRPYAKILYSDTAVIAPFKDHTAFQFRIANKRSSHQMVDVEIEVLLSIVDVDKRRFKSLDLEYKKINFFNSTWTVNHPINEESPLYGLSESDLNDAKAEFLILLKGFDDTFAQVIHWRSSYRYDEIVWSARFKSIYTISEEGMTTIELDKISDYEKV
ncbi:MAG: ion channel [bacterium]|nr:ion channel [bacterium]